MVTDISRYHRESSEVFFVLLGLRYFSEHQLFSHNQATVVEFQCGF